MKLACALIAISALLSPSSAAVNEPVVIGNVQQFYLVNASNERFVRVLNDGDTISLCEDGTALTVCVDTSWEVSAVQMSIDGEVYPHQMLAPFCLGATNLGPSDYPSSDRLIVPGSHTITGTPYKLNGVDGVPGVTKGITINTSDCAVLPEPAPTDPPTKAPTAVVVPEEIVGSITGWYLVNAATDTFIKYVNNGEVIDHAVLGKELNLCVDTKGDVGSVRMTINGRQPGHHNRPPFCLAADESRPTATFEAVPELEEYGTYSIVATPFFEDELQGEVGVTENLSVVVVDSNAPSSAPSDSFAASDVGEISKWYLVNAATNSFVRYLAFGEVIYQSVDGTALNICVDTLGDVASVKMVLNGKTFSHHNIPPFCLGADEAGPPQTFDAVSELSSTGTFSLTGTPYERDELGGLIGTSQTIIFRINAAPGRVRTRG